MGECEPAEGRRNTSDAKSPQRTTTPRQGRHGSAHLQSQHTTQRLSQEKSGPEESVHVYTCARRQEEEEKEEGGKGGNRRKRRGKGKAKRGTPNKCHSWVGVDTLWVQILSDTRPQSSMSAGDIMPAVFSEVLWGFPSGQTNRGHPCGMDHYVSLLGPQEEQRKLGNEQGGGSSHPRASAK